MKPCQKHVRANERIFLNPADLKKKISNEVHLLSENYSAFLKAAQPANERAATHKCDRRTDNFYQIEKFSVASP